MENKQSIYLDKVVEFLVRDTNIDYENEKIIQFPFILLRRRLNLVTFVLLPSTPTHSSFLLFSEYCKNVYGLTGQEIDYVWDQYRTIILDKITNK